MELKKYFENIMIFHRDRSKYQNISTSWNVCCRIFPWHNKQKYISWTITYIYGDKCWILKRLSGRIWMREKSDKSAKLHLLEKLYLRVRTHCKNYLLSHTFDPRLVFGFIYNRPCSAILCKAYFVFLPGIHPSPTTKRGQEALPAE